MHRMEAELIQVREHADSTVRFLDEVLPSCSWRLTPVLRQSVENTRGRRWAETQAVPSTLSFRAVPRQMSLEQGNE